MAALLFSLKGQEDNVEQVRLNKFLSDAGVCSRREADRLVEEGLITVNGELACLGMKIDPNAQIKVRGKDIRQEKEKVLLVFHKPAGIVCTAEKREKNNIIDFLNYPKRIYPIGRLDKDSTGLLLLTNDGQLVNKIMRAGNYHEKEYIVTINKPVTEAFCEKMSDGVPILDTVTRKCKVWQTGEKEFHIVLTQGLNRQIRRMCETLGCQVTALRRIRIMNVKLGDLKSGTYRDISEAEYKELMRRLEDSSSLSVKQRNENQKVHVGKHADGKVGKNKKEHAKNKESMRNIKNRNGK